MRFRFACLLPAVIAAASSLLGLSGCQPAPEEFSTLQPIFFASVNLFDDKARRELPMFEQRMDRMAEALLARLDRGEITDPAARSEAGRALLYTAFVYITTHHAFEDGYMSLAEATAPHRFAAQEDDAAELLARMQHAAQLLSRASALLPDDARLRNELLSTRFNQELFTGTISQETLDAWIAEAHRDRFGLFTTILLFRDPALFPLDSPHMERLLEVACSPSPIGFDCSRMGPPPEPGAMEPRWLTSKVAGPVLLSDLLIKRAEALVARADRDPAMAMPALGEAMGRVQVAAGALILALINVEEDDLAIYPAKDTLDARQGRIAEVRAAVSARLTGMPTAPPLPEAKQYYAGRTYRAAYQCAACHVARPDLPASFLGVPK